MIGNSSEEPDVEFADGFVPKMSPLLGPVLVGVVGWGIGLAGPTGQWASPTPSLWTALGVCPTSPL